MMRRKFIVLGDRTSHGGYVVSARGAGPVKWSIDGKPVACVGDIVYCPKCKGTHRIIEGAFKPFSRIGGVLKAVEGCLTSCGAVLISVGQSRSWYEGEIGIDALTVETLQAEARAREEAAAARMAKNMTDADWAAVMERSGRNAAPPASQNSSAQRYKGCFVLCDKITDEPLTGFAYGISHRSGEHCDTVYDDGLTAKAYSEEAIDVALRFAMQTEIGIR